MKSSLIPLIYYLSLPALLIFHMYFTYCLHVLFSVLYQKLLEDISVPLAPREMRGHVLGIQFVCLIHELQISLHKSMESRCLIPKVRQVYTVVWSSNTLY